MQTGRLNNLAAIRQSGPGMFLDSGDGREILLPKREIPEDLEPGKKVAVFVYRDSEDRLIATTRTPKIMVGQCAFLKVLAVNNTGAFLDWGLPKDLLVPYSQQAVRMEAGESYVVTAYLDRNTDRVVASSRLGRCLQEEGPRFRVGQPVDLLVASRTDLGWKAVINHTHVGLIRHRDAVRPLRTGLSIKGFIKCIRGSDQRIDLAVTPEGAKSGRGLAEEIIEHLESHGGRSDLTDHAAPGRILEVFGVSKGHYKRTLGALYRERRIVIGDNEITLSGSGDDGRQDGADKSSGAVVANAAAASGKTPDGEKARSGKRARGEGRGQRPGPPRTRGTPGRTGQARSAHRGGASRGRGGRATSGSGKSRH